MNVDLVERYWVHTPELLAARLAELVEQYPGMIESFELCKNNVGDSVPGCRMGKGPRHVFLLGREHGHEPVGPCSLTALVESLTTATRPGSDRSFPEAPVILEAMTLHIFPVMNPDGAHRFASQVPESFPGSYFTYGQEDSDRYRQVHSEPGLTLNNNRPPHYTPEEMATWRQTGKPIGSLFTEDGVELWMDWDHDKAPQTRALKEQMREFPPSLFVDVHAWESPTQILMPKADDAEAARLQALGALVYDALAAADLPPTGGGSVGDLGEDTTISPVWVHRTYGAAAFLYEIDGGYRWFRPERRPEDVTLPTMTKEQIILSGWHGVAALLKGMLTAPVPAT